MSFSWKSKNINHDSISRFHSFPIPVKTLIPSRPRFCSPKQFYGLGSNPPHTLRTRKNLLQKGLNIFFYSENACSVCSLSKRSSLCCYLCIIVFVFIVNVVDSSFLSSEEPKRRNIGIQFREQSLVSKIPNGLLLKKCLKFQKNFKHHFCHFDHKKMF